MSHRLLHSLFRTDAIASSPQVCQTENQLHSQCPPSAAPPVPSQILSVIAFGGTRRFGGNYALAFLHFVEMVGSQICESLHFSRGPGNVSFTHAVVTAEPK